jgi:hypothetical protein
MFIERIDVTGFSGLRRWEATFGRATRVDGSARGLVALGDAVQLAFAAWDHDALRALLTRWGCRDVKIEGEALPEAAQWESAPGLASVVDRAGDGLLVVGLTISLDPPQFGRLRRIAARDPRVVDALAEGALLTVRVGARFSPGFDAVAIDPLAFLIGGESFPIAGSERPAWLTPFLQSLRGRLHRGPAQASRWGDAAKSWRAEDQRALRRALAALAQPPGNLGDAVALPEGPGVLEEDAVVPVWHFGEAGSLAAGLVGAVHLSGAEIVLVEKPPADWLEWLAAQAEADGSPLEQVLLLGVPGGLTLG